MANVVQRAILGLYRTSFFSGVSGMGAIVGLGQKQVKHFQVVYPTEIARQPLGRSAAVPLKTSFPDEHRKRQENRAQSKSVKVPA